MKRFRGKTAKLIQEFVKKMSQSERRFFLSWSVCGRKFASESAEKIAQKWFVCLPRALSFGDNFGSDRVLNLPTLLEHQQGVKKTQKSLKCRVLFTFFLPQKSSILTQVGVNCGQHLWCTEKSGYFWIERRVLK